MRNLILFLSSSLFIAAPAMAGTTRLATCQATMKATKATINEGISRTTTHTKLYMYDLIRNEVVEPITFTSDDLPPGEALSFYLKRPNPSSSTAEMHFVSDGHNDSVVAILNLAPDSKNSFEFTSKPKNPVAERDVYSYVFSVGCSVFEF